MLNWSLISSVHVLRRRGGKKNETTLRSGVSLEGRVGENGDSQEHRRDAAAGVGDDGQDLLVSRVQPRPGDVLDAQRTTVTVLAVLRGQN